MNFNIPPIYIYLALVIFGAGNGLLIGIFLGIFKVTRPANAILTATIVTFAATFCLNILFEIGDIRSGFDGLIRAIFGFIFAATVLVVPNIFIGMVTAKLSSLIIDRIYGKQETIS